MIDGFLHNSNQPLLYSTDGQSRMVAEINGNSQVHFVWPEVTQEMSLRLTNPLTSIHIIPTLTEKVFTDYAGDNTEYVIITHPDLMQIGTESEYVQSVSYTHLRAHETVLDLVCRLLLEKKKKMN